LEEDRASAVRGRDRLLVAALCAYFALVGIAAWPAPVRPAALDALHAGANRALQAVSIMPGHKVFAIPDRATETAVANCFYIRGFDRRAQPHDLWPPDGQCMRRGVRLRSAAFEIYLDRTFRLAVAQLGSPEAAIDHAHTFASIGGAFCGDDGSGAPEYDTIGLVWQSDIRSYEDGSQYEQPVLAFSWSCTAQEITFAQWFPEPAVIAPFFRAAK
jgi:hypothetical protein